MIVCVENPKESTKLSAFSKFIGYKVSTQKPVIILFSRNENLEIEIFKNTIYNSTKNHEIKGTNLTKHV